MNVISFRVTDANREEFQKLIDEYSSVNGKHNVIVELKMWKIKLALSCDNIIKNSLKALQIYNKDVYPNIYFLFKIFITLPVSAITPEWSFLILKRSKSYCRNSVN